MRLVADVGGTNTRLALSQGGDVLPGSIRSYQNADYDDLDSAVARFLSEAPQPRPTEMVIAVAGPVHGDRAELTNRNWQISADSFRDRFGATRVRLLNDLTALGHAVPTLGAHQLRQIAPGSVDRAAMPQSLVVGIGTGFNVSPVLHSAGAVFCPATEAGHVSLPSSVVSALNALGLSADPFPTVEALFSGRGFATFCRQSTGRTDLDGPAAMAAYGSPEADDVTRSIDQYSALAGWLLRDLTLAYLPHDGLYFAGSVARAVLSCAPAACIDILNRPCDILGRSRPPLWIVEDDSAALFGCAQYSQF